MTQPPTPETGVPTCYRHPGRETYIACQRCSRPICPDCMRDAAVGFQCPECVAEGRRTTREARTRFGGRPTSGTPYVTLTLLGINLAVFALVLATGGATSVLVDWLSLHAQGRCVANGGIFVNATTQALCSSATPGTWVPGVADGGYWELITSVFLHVQVLHIGFNMLALYVLGPQLEQVLGRGRYLALYLLSGLAGSALVYWAAGEQTTTLGASGAIFGLMAALLVIAHRIGADYRQIGMWIGLNFLITVFGSGISWQGHLGGFIGGAAIAGVLAYAPSGARKTTVQVAGLSLIGVVIALAIVTRTLSLA